MTVLDELWSDMSGASGSRDDSGPQVVLIIDGAAPLTVAHHPAVASVIVVGMPDKDVMSETQRRQRWHVIDQWEAHAADEGIALRADHGMISALTTSGLDTFAQADMLSEQEFDVLARSMARYTRPTADVLAEHSSEGIDEVELVLGVATPLLVSPSSAWTEKRGAERLHIPLGVNNDGGPFYLDIKESAEGGSGPHGLCVGATGSGKSELLRTLVLSLVASHSPEQLNLVLVDFKGGATFIGMERLPHVAAVITNLDDESALVDRMEDALQGELTRRQEFLRAHGVSSLVEYADMRRQYSARGTGDDGDYPRLPALVIIIDEFSELLSAHPGFIDTFVAIGRLGDWAIGRLGDWAIGAFSGGPSSFSDATTGRRTITGTRRTSELPHRASHIFCGGVEDRSWRQRRPHSSQGTRVWSRPSGWGFHHRISCHLCLPTLE